MCCGNNRPKMQSGAKLLAPPSAPPPRGDYPPAASAPGKPVFEYSGETALTVVSPMTRRTYRFDRPGARLEVEIADRAWIAFIPNLQRVVNS